MGHKILMCNVFQNERWESKRAIIEQINILRDNWQEFYKAKERYQPTNWSTWNLKQDKY